MNNKGKLFIVEFGKPDMGSSYISFGSGTQKPLFVIANSYDEAAKKAMIYAESKTETQSVIGADGSLNLNNEELMVKSVRLACDEIVW
ncbi:MAG: hypothetical protein IPJ13_30625 [Saprospiraceae bacterium]|nr:hypothetical protein [Saprospiraceae bacterium]